MAMVPLRQMGQYGFVPDIPPGDLPPQAWSQVRNVTFKGPYIAKRLEPESIDPPVPGGGVIWAEQFFDGTIVRLVAATRTDLYLLSADGAAWANVTRLSGQYLTPVDGYWQAFPWGNTVVFNNGVDIPQVYDPTAAKFIDLPRWGIVTDDNGTPGYDTGLLARVLVPFKNYLVALNLSWTDPVGDPFLEDRNRIWWSDAYTTPNLWEVPNNYPWDYADPTTLSGQNLIGLEDGPLQWAQALGQDLVLYTSTSATIMQLVGDAGVFDFLRLFGYGCVGIHGATEFNNQHFVIAADTMYIHDGQTVVMIGEDRVRDWFFDSVRNLETGIRLVTDPAQREILIQFDSSVDATLYPEPTAIGSTVRLALVFNYEDNNFYVIDAMAEESTALADVVCILPGLDLQQKTAIGGTWADAVGAWEDQSQTWAGVAGDPTAAAVKTSTFWFTADVAYRANSLAIASPFKSYMVKKNSMNLDEIFSDATSNFWLHISQMYPHAVGDGSMRVRAGWAPDLESNPVWGAFKTFNFGDAFTPADYKLDFRQTGRYLALEFDFRDVNQLRLSGADVDLKLTYGR